MILVGLSWLLYWLLVKVFTVEVLLAALVTGLGFVAVGLIQGERPYNRDRP